MPTLSVAAHSDGPAGAISVANAPFFTQITLSSCYHQPDQNGTENRNFAKIGKAGELPLIGNFTPGSLRNGFESNLRAEVLATSTTILRWIVFRFFSTFP
jgi:hypothetical protein